VADDLARVINIPRNDVKVVFNPIIFPEMRIKKEATFADPWFDTGQPPVILAIGRLTKQKGFDTLIRAFSEVRKQRQVHLLILGEGEDRVPLTNLIKELNLDTEVRLPGFVSNPYPYLVNASLFVLSSRWEGLPTVLVEALYCEVPIIATDCPSGSREILKDGKYGRLVPVEDIDGLIREINSVLDGNRAAITPDSWQPFESTTVIRQYEKLMLGISG
jgi:glycosyltransferase involved in cell wall biosynthesis